MKNVLEATKQEASKIISEIKLNSICQNLKKSYERSSITEICFHLKCSVQFSDASEGKSCFLVLRCRFLWPCPGGREWSIMCWVVFISLWNCPVSCYTVIVPCYDAVCQYAIHGAVKLKLLLCLLHWCGGVGCPCEVFCDGASQKFKTEEIFFPHSVLRSEVSTLSH